MSQQTMHRESHDCDRCGRENELRELDIAPRPFAKSYHMRKYRCECGHCGYVVDPVVNGGRHG